MGSHKRIDFFWCGFLASTGTGAIGDSHVLAPGPDFGPTSTEAWLFNEFPLVVPDKSVVDTEFPGAVRAQELVVKRKPGGIL